MCMARPGVSVYLTLNAAQLQGGGWGVQAEATKVTVRQEGSVAQSPLQGLISRWKYESGAADWQRPESASVYVMFAR